MTATTNMEREVVNADVSRRRTPEGGPLSPPGVPAPPAPWPPPLLLSLLFTAGFAAMVLL